MWYFTIKVHADHGLKSTKVSQECTKQHNARLETDEEHLMLERDAAGKPECGAHNDALHATLLTINRLH